MERGNPFSRSRIQGAVEKTLAIVIVDSSLVLWGIENGLAWVRGLKRKRVGRTVERDLGSNPLRLSFLFKSVVCGYCFVTFDPHS